MSETVERSFSVEDHEVPTCGDAFADALEESYLSSFTAFMPSVFTADFLADLKGAVEDVRAIPTDEFFVKKQAKETLDVEMVRSECAFEIRLLRVYAGKAYRDNPGVLGTFNFSGLSKARGSSEKMRTFISNLISVVEDNLTDLIAADYPETKLDELKRLLVDLDREWDEQSAVMRERVQLTNHRIKALNHLWALMKELSEVREFALADDPAGQEIFKLPQRNCSSSKDSEEL